MANYLSVRSKFSIQGYIERVDRSTEEMGMPFLPLGVEESRREADSNQTVQIEGRKI